MDNTNTAELLKSLESLYTGSNFKDARKLVLENKTTLDPSTFHFVLGTLDAKLGDFAAGRYHLEKAIKLGNLNPETYHNLTAITQELTVSDISASTSFVDQVAHYGKSIPGDLYLTWMLCFLLCSAIFIKKLLKSKIVLIAILLLSILPYIFGQFYLGDKSYAIALHEASLKEGPSEIYEEIGKVEAGAKIIVGKIYKNYYFVEHPNFKNGWVKKEDLAIY